MKRSAIFYISSLLIFISLVWYFLYLGSKFETQSIQSIEKTYSSESTDSLFQFLQQNIKHSVAILLLQILIILLTVRLFGWLMTKIKQPIVVGEIIAGIILGPSLFGLFFPAIQQSIFPLNSLPNLQLLSQFGLVLFMFIIGMELDLNILKGKAPAALMISHVSIIFPFFLGVVLAYFTYQQYASQTSFSAYALFTGITMSVTAFPVLARILQEKELTKTPLGSMVLTCAAADDVTSWCLLALVISIVNASGLYAALFSLILAIAFITFMIFIIKPIIKRVAERYFVRETVKKPIIIVIFAIIIFSSFISEVIGIHALFGAFMAGTIMPSNIKFKDTIREKIEDVSMVILLPLFFVITGLRTQIGLLNNIHLWLVCFAVILTAVLGKFLGSTIPAKLSGETWKDSIIIGILMNARGLMGFIILNIGYDLEILSAEIFTMMVIMALVTTVMTGPSLDLVQHYFEKKHAIILPKTQITKIKKVLVSFGPPKSGERLLKILSIIGITQNKQYSITGLHLTPSADISIHEAEKHEKDAFALFHRTAKDLEISVKTKYIASNNVSRDIVNFANNENFSLLLVGSSRPFFSDEETGGRVKNFLNEVKCNVAVLLDRPIDKIQQISLIIQSHEDFLVDFCKEILNKSEYSIHIHTNNNDVVQEFQNKEAMDRIPIKIVMQYGTFELSEFTISPEQLIICSLNTWEQLKKYSITKKIELPPVLILKNKG